MQHAIHRITRLFPLWAVLFSLWAYLQPDLFTPWEGAIVPLLTVVMFGMGTTLVWKDFRRVLDAPLIVAVGVSLQFLIMPLSAFVISTVLGLTAAFTAGMVVVGSSPGGTASNVICYLAGGDVALSITLTMTSTVCALFATPGLSYVYLQHIVPVPFYDMLLSVLQIVIVPVALGTTINTLLGSPLEKVKDVFPLVSIVAIVVIIAIIVGLNRGNLVQVGGTLLGAVVLHNLIGLAVGYGVIRGLGYDRITARTVSIEVGMQNSGLGVALASRYFSSAAALPGALFSIWHNLSGSFLAAVWGGERQQLEAQLRRDQQEIRS